MRRAVVCCMVVAVAATVLAAAQGVRVVDSVVVGQAGDEAAHHFAGNSTVTGKAAGRTWRSATGWFSYSLRIYDDSPLAIICVLADGEGASESFDILVDGKTSATVTRQPMQSKAADVRVNLKLQDTEGRTSVVVKLAAHPGSRTARVLEVRTLQEHLE
jgi:uncharacterized protein